jgi:enoyl-CoA hydratase/carnithine racemase
MGVEQAGASEPVVVDRRDQATWITLNRPDRRNAYDEDMLGQMLAAIAETPHDHFLVITGSGGSFCAGGYLGNLASAGEGDVRRMFFGSLKLFDALRGHGMPVIAAVNGFAIGGGNELVVACDLAIAAQSAVFGQSGPRVGSAPVLGGTNMLALSIGEKRAKEVSFFCRKYSADEALALGWINSVVPDAELEAAADAAVAELAAMSPRYLEIAKVSSNVWWNAARDSYVTGLGMLVQAIGSEDMREGAQAFLEKRTPRFREVRTKS